MKIGERTTRADVARKAGVSETIVSYVINNNRYVAKEKRLRVEQAITELNYRPNNVARTLKGKHSNQLLFIADQITNEFFSRIVSDMDQYAYEAGYLISLCANRNTREFVSQVISRQYDGIIISSASFPMEYIKEFTNVGIPVLVFRRHMGMDYPPGVAVIDTGLYTGGRGCVRHLAQTGRRMILYVDKISRRGNRSPRNDSRLSGFLDEMKEWGLPVSEDQNIISGCRSEEELKAAVLKKLLSTPQIDGIFGRNDMVACIAMQASAEAGRMVGSDIGIIGFDNSSVSRFCQPRLSTMEMQREEISKNVIRIIVGMINGMDPQIMEFETKLIRRNST